MRPTPDALPPIHVQRRALLFYHGVHVHQIRPPNIAFLVVLAMEIIFPSNFKAQEGRSSNHFHRNVSGFRNQPNESDIGRLLA